MRCLEEQAAAAKLGQGGRDLHCERHGCRTWWSLFAHTGRGGEVLLNGDSAHHAQRDGRHRVRLAGLFYRPIPSTRGAPNLEDIRDLLQGTAQRQQARDRARLHRDHAQQRRGHRHPARLHRRNCARSTAEKNVPVHIDGARMLQCGGCARRGRRRNRGTWRQHRFLRQQGHERAVRIGAVRLGGLRRTHAAYRRMVSGGMRQAGVIAAAGIVALERVIDRLAKIAAAPSASPKASTRLIRASPTRGWSTRIS